MKDNLNISKDGIPIPNRTLFGNDNLIVLRSMIKSDCIDLIYLDPPFNSGTNYTLGEKGFRDNWKNSEESKILWVTIEVNSELKNFISLVEKIHGVEMKSYLIYLSVRLIEMHRVLKPSGRIALHCDDNASHYLKVCLDIIFGKENFRNDIALLYKNGSKNAKTHFPRNKDNILIYSKDVNQTKFFNTKGSPSLKTLKNIEKGFKITWNTRSGKWHETYYRDPETFDDETKRLLDQDRKKKLIERPAEIHIRRATNGKEIKYLDWWDDMTIIPQSEKRINDPSSESVGWPTQKNVHIPQRVIECCTEPRDIVLDPFCGSGTTCVAAEHLSRKWIGIDISPDAIDITENRMNEFLGIFSETIYRCKEKEVENGI